MLFKEDWDEAKPHFEAWWQREIVDRVALSIRAPREHPIPDVGLLPEPAEPADDTEYWTDAGYRVARAESQFSRTSYLGEAFPFFSTDIGPGTLAVHLGSPPSFDKNTVWYNPVLETLAVAPKLEFNLADPWWKANLDLVRAGTTRGKEKYLTTLPDLVENLDTLASLRGTEPLLYDLIEHPGTIHEAQRQILEAFFVGFDAIYELLEPATPGGGCASLFQVWGPGRVAKVQCDFSAMISPSMFREFVIPYLAEQCQRLDYTVYHLDGPNAMCHAKALCEIPELNAIQWTPGAAFPGCGHPMWLDFYRQIRADGKGLLLLGLEPEEVEPLVRAIGPEGLFISTEVKSEQVAERMLRDARNWTKSA